MASRSRAGSGGKILRPRRLARVATPYERPLDAAPRPQNPNWVSKFIFSPTKVIASTAGKFISSVLGPESSSSSSSYSGSDDEFDEENEDIINSSLGVDELTKNDGSGTRKAPAVSLENQQNKLLIEQLILQESFSWEECIKFISIIRSRVVEDPVHIQAGGAGPSEVPNKGLNTDMPDLLNAALMEARKWLKNKKGLSQEEEMEYAVGGVDPNISQDAAEGEVSSPVDVARSYMKERPPWASPCLIDAALRATTPNKAPLFMEDMPVSAGDSYLLYPKVKRDTAMSGSWNISEEIRRVRSKATEEMLRTPSTKFDLSKSKLKSSSAAKIDWSGSSLQQKNSINSFTANDLEGCLGDKAHASTNLNDSSPQDVAPTTMHSGRKENGTPIVDPPILTSEKDQDLEDNMIRAYQDDPLEASGNPGNSNQQNGNIIPALIETRAGVDRLDLIGVDSRVSDGMCSMSKEDLFTDDEVPAPTSVDGFPHSSSSLKPRKEEDMEEGERRVTTPLPAAVEEQTTGEEGGGLSQESWSKQYEELSSQSQDAAAAAAAVSTPKRPKRVIRYVKRTTTTRGQNRARSSK